MKLTALARNTSGQGLIEYAMILGVIGTTVLGAAHYVADAGKSIQVRTSAALTSPGAFTAIARSTCGVSATMIVVQNAAMQNQAQSSDNCNDARPPAR